MKTTSRSICHVNIVRVMSLSKAPLVMASHRFVVDSLPNSFTLVFKLVRLWKIL